MSSIRKSRPRLVRTTPGPSLPSSALRREPSAPAPLSPVTPPVVDLAQAATDAVPRTTRPSAVEQVERWRQEGAPVHVLKVSRMLEDLHQEHGLIRQTRPRLDASVPHVAIEAHPSAADLKTRRFLAAQQVMNRFWERLEPRLAAKQQQLVARADAGERLNVARLRKETARLFRAVHKQTFAQLPPGLRAEYDEATRASLHGFDADRHFQSGQDFALSLCFGFLSHCEAMPAAHAKRSGVKLPASLFEQPFVGEGFRFIQFIATMHFDIAPAPFGLSDDQGHGLGNLQLMELNDALHLAVSADALPPLDSLELVFTEIAKKGIAPRFGCPALSAVSAQRVNAVGALTQFVQTVAARHVFPTVEAQLAASGQLATASTP